MAGGRVGGLGEGESRPRRRRARLCVGRSGPQTPPPLSAVLSPETSCWASSFASRARSAAGGASCEEMQR